MAQHINVYPVNRVEGDLEIQLRFSDQTVSDAFSIGTMFRGFENIMIGRPPLDSLVITPRVCGICSTSHLYAAARSLDMLYHAEVPQKAHWIRNIALMVESLQNDIRHSVMLFMPDFLNAAYQQRDWYADITRRFEPLRGSATRQAVDETRKVLEIIAILGGQWPHSSFMVPGGVTSMPSPNELNRCAYLLTHFKRWYERQILGCSIDRWRAVDSRSALMAWLDENQAQAGSDLGCFLRVATDVGLNHTGKGHGNYICFGVPELDVQDPGSRHASSTSNARSGFFSAGKHYALKQEEISEDVSHSWFLGDKGRRHPYRGSSAPYATGSEDRRYSWAKAPRYMGLPAETGPLAQMVIRRDPLFMDYVSNAYAGTLVRQLARLVRPASIIPLIESCIQRAIASQGKYYQENGRAALDQGHGLVEAPRGALGHWIGTKDNKISSYQIITPTTWNGSPRDVDGIRGPWEQAVIGTEIANLEDPVEIQHIVHSFDPCLVCTVHAVDIRHRRPIPESGT